MFGFLTIIALSVELITLQAITGPHKFQKHILRRCFRSGGGRIRTYKRLSPV
jgi:hypothetical protein